MEQSMIQRDPREVVEVYRPNEPQEVVEVYTRPLPRAMIPKPLTPTQKRKKKRGKAVILFAVFMVTAAVSAAAARFLPRLWTISGENYDDIIPSGSYEEDSTEITIPTYPFGQGAQLTIAREKGQVLTPQEIYQKVNPSVVTVMVQLSGASDYTRLGVGTGVIVTSDGYILTNHHVVEGGRDCSVMLSTGHVFQAKYVASDAENDLAVLKVDQTDLPTVVLADSDSLTVGDKVYAIGNPLGVELRGTFTDGIVSAINRDVQVDGRSMTLVQTNAALNTGNSGGPLINRYGQVVGINTIKMYSDFSTVEGLGFAIPTSTLEYIVNQLLEYGEVLPEPRIGVSVSTIGEVLPNGDVGVLVQVVEPNSAADRAGVLVDDYVVEADGEQIASSGDLLRVRRRFRVGDQMELKLWRSGEYLTVTLQLLESVED